MSNTPHELSGEFPNHISLMRHLRETDGHFLRISNAYHDVNRAIHRAETDIEPMDDRHVTELRKQRMRLKDEIFERLERYERPPGDPKEG